LIYILGMLRSSTGEELYDVTGLGLRGGAGVLKLYGFAGAFVGILVAAVVAFQKNVAGVQNLIPILYKIPVVGEALQTITLARFCWTLALSIEAGIEPIRAIHLSLDATDSDYYRSAKDDIVRSIHQGKSISETLHSTGIFPEDFITEIGVAEMSGTDAEAMHHLAAQYDVRATSAMRTLAKIASGAIWSMVIVGMVVILMKMVMGISDQYNQALEATRI
jgi:type II secretory pathway component PulF